MVQNTLSFSDLTIVGIDSASESLVSEAAPRWLRFSPKRFIAENVSNSFKDKMNILRKQDDAIHEWTKDLNKIVSLMNKYLKQSKMVELGYLLDTFNKRLVQVGIFGKEIHDMSDAAKLEFDTKNHDIGKLHKKFEKSAFLEGIGREWLAERLLGGKFRTERKEKLQKIIDLAVKVVDKVDDTLDKMHQAKVDGNVAQYSELLTNIAHYQNVFFEAYKPAYDEYLKSYVDAAMKEHQEKQKKKDELALPEKPSNFQNNPAPTKSIEPETGWTPKEKQFPQEEINLDVPSMDELINTIPENQESQESLSPEIPNLETPPQAPQPRYSRKPIPNTPPAKLTTPEMQGVFPPQDQDINLEIEEEENNLEEPQKQINAHGNFYKQLEKLAQKDMGQAINFVLKYAEEIEDTDLETSLKLLAVAEGFLNG